jgi:hypothetical protein
MLNDFLPAIISVAILVAVFLYAWISDLRRIRRLSPPEPVQSSEPLELWTESSGGISAAPTPMQ